LSPRRAKPFVKLNCARIPTGLLESELFGHEKAHSPERSAQTHLAVFEVAGRGTIFLDEIGEIPLELQTNCSASCKKGSSSAWEARARFRTDARLVAGTKPRFTSDGERAEVPIRSLFFRLNVFPVHVPPLRDRQGDIRFSSGFHAAVFRRMERLWIRFRLRQ